MSVDDKDDNDSLSAMGDALSQAELDYMASGGEKVEGLTADAPAADPKADAPAAEVAAPTAAAKPAADAKPDAAAKPDAVAKVEPETPDDPDAPIDPAKPPKTVSFHKFRRIEERMRAAEKDRGDLAEKFARGDERLRLLTEALAPQKPDGQGEDVRPNPQEDIFAAFEWQSRKIDQLEAALNGTRQTIETRHATDDLKTEYQRDAITFARETPDFGAAYTHLLNTRGAMLESQGYDVNQVRQILATEERGLVERARATGRRPSEMVYQLAQQLGYRKADATAAVAAAPAAKSEAPAGASAIAPAKPSVTEEIERIKAGQAAGKSLSGAGGAADELSVEGLALMSDHEFEALLRKSPKKVEALMGRAH